MKPKTNGFIFLKMESEITEWVKRENYKTYIKGLGKGRSMEKKYIGPNYKIFELMRERGISQKELSKRTGIPTSTISDWKRKGTVPSSDKIIAICKALNVRVDEVFEQIEKDETNQRVITKQDDLWDFVCEYDEMEPAKKKRLLSYMMALLKVERDKNDGVSSEE